MKLAGALFLLSTALLPAQALLVTAVNVSGEPIPAAFSVWQRNQEQHSIPEIHGSSGHAISLEPGEYTLRIASDFFLDETIEGIRIVDGQTKTLDRFELVFEGMTCSPAEARPHHYRDLNTPGSGSLSGVIVTRDGEKAIVGTTVTLYAPRIGKVATTTTDADGRFSFSGVPARRDYWVRTTRSGYFDDEFTDLVVQSGLDTVYERLGLEACAPGRCDSSPKTLRILPGCA
jgi:carboxypeptidase family protein